MAIEERDCCAHTLCVEICPQVFEMGPVVARVRPEAQAHFESAAAAIRLAARCCPIEAIRVDVEPTT